MQTTRQKILEYLRRHGEGSVHDLGEHLALAAPGVRQHLTVLRQQDLVAVSQARGQVGRPALIYSLTPSGSALFPNRYDDLSNLLIEEIRSIAGSKGLQAILMRVAARSAEPYETRLKGHDLSVRIQEATQIINERGSVADTSHNSGEDYLINQYTCPFPNVAKSHSSVCALDVEFVRLLTGGDARLVQSLLRGDRACSYRVRPALMVQGSDSPAARTAREVA